MKNFNWSISIFLCGIAFVCCGNNALLGWIQPSSPHMGEDANGDLIAVWTSYDDLGTGFKLVRASTWDGSSWSTNQTISLTDRDSAGGMLYVNNVSSAAVVLWRSFGPDGNSILYGRIYDGSDWDMAPTQLSEDYDDVSIFQATINNSGDIAAIYQAYVPTVNDRVIYVIQGTISGGWDALSTITPISDHN